MYAANFVLYEYGTGAVMAVPAHDQRDFEFAKKYGLPIVVVVQPEGEPLDGGSMPAAHEGPGKLVRSGEFDGLANEEGKRAITRFLEGKDWAAPRSSTAFATGGVSRQRYWGCPIPVIHCEACGIVPVPEEDLPVVLPRTSPIRASAGTRSPRWESWLRVPCPGCGKPARRETDTFDTFVESSWYFLR